MASERDELNRRRRARMEQERRRKAARRKLKIRLVIAAVVILACAAVIYNLGRNGEIPLIEAAPTEVEIYGQADETTVETTVPKSNLNREPTVIHLAAAGAGAAIVSAGYWRRRSFNKPIDCYKIPESYGTFWEVSLATLKDAYQSRAAQTFMEEYKRYLEESAPFGF